jgi:hypothetical protein
LSCTRSRRVRCVSRSFEGSEGCVPIHSWRGQSIAFRGRDKTTNFGVGLLLLDGEVTGSGGSELGGG